MIFYLTFNDQPSGIYASQVIDVVRFMNAEGAKVKLVAFLSLRNFRQNRAVIRRALPSAVVLPMFPGVKRWKNNYYSLKALCLWYRPAAIIGRSVLATALALRIRNTKTVYDGRGAIAAEWREYAVISEAGMLAEIDETEKRAVQESDFRIAVSQQLVKHWQQAYGYTGHAHVVIPCTVNKVFEAPELTAATLSKARADLGYNDQDVVYVYSGSVAGWQSFELMAGFLNAFLEQSVNNKVLFLSPEDQNIARLKEAFPAQLACKSVAAASVPHYLLAADYGLLIRERSVTNLVASPVKFAEYLFCGLKVFISEGLGDYTAFVAANGCGRVYDGTVVTERPALAEKQRMRQLAQEYFTKQAHKGHYLDVIRACRETVI